MRPIEMFDPTHNQKKDSLVCTTCNARVLFLQMDALSQREWHISGMCQACQDSVFNADEADDE